MRSLGVVLLVSGILGFVYCGDRVQRLDPVPAETSWRRGLDYPAGRWETARYACALGGGIGLLLMLFPKGR